MNPAVDVSTSVERMTPAHKLRCSTAQQDPGGGGINVARVILRLGGNVMTIYPVGGATGQLLRRLVDAEEIQSVTDELSEETRLSFTVMEKETGEEYRFVFPGPTLSEPEWRQCLDRIGSLPNRPDIFVISGSLPPGVPEDFYASVARIAKASGAKVVLDTSGSALRAALHEGLYLIKPNLRELRELTCAPLDDQNAWVLTCRELVRAGRAEVVALTLGEKGALLVTHDMALRATALPIQPVSTVGAGDSFVGAMIWALAGGKDMKDAFRYGVAAGSAALLTPGTELCAREDVERLYSEVRLIDV
jgi:6-phosphofructokinase 2